MARIAHVDDDRLILSSTRRWLHRTKHESAMFESPEELLFQLEAGVRYDVIIADETMGNGHMTGHVFIAKAQEVIRQQGHTTKFIHMTSESPNSTADLFLQKPVDGPDIIAAIEQLLR